MILAAEAATAVDDGLEGLDRVVGSRLAFPALRTFEGLVVGGRLVQRLGLGGLVLQDGVLFEFLVDPLFEGGQGQLQDVHRLDESAE